MHPDQQKWDRIYREKTTTLPQPAEVLAQNRHLLPASGTALDLACGLGGNSLLLAQAGLTVSSWDISPIAVERLRHFAVEQDVKINAQVRDVLADPPEAANFDVIVVSHFLERTQIQKWGAALKPNGLLFYQTYSVDKVDEIGPRNPDYLLKTNELLQLFPELVIRVYREEGTIGDTTQGWRNQAMLVAQKMA